METRLLLLAVPADAASNNMGLSLLFRLGQGYIEKDAGAQTVSTFFFYTFESLSL